MDLAEFEVVRSPRRISILDPLFVMLDPGRDATSGPSVSRADDSQPHGVRPEGESSTEHDRRVEAVETVSRLDPEGVLSAGIVELGHRGLESTESASYAATTISIDPDYVRVLLLLAVVDQWLVLHEDRMAGKEVHAYMESQTKRAGYDTPTHAWKALEQFKPVLLNGLISMINGLNPAEDIMLMTRRIMIHGLLTSPDLGKMQALQVWDQLHNRIPVLAPGKFSAARLPQFAPLVRGAAVADLAVVRKEWVCYLPGEIATIRNVMAGESFSHTMRNVRETEEIEQTETEERTQTQTEAEQRTDTELSNEINTQLNMSLSGYLNVTSEFRYPIGTTTINAGINGDISYERSTRHASKIAQQAVSRATSNVDKRTREWRQRRELQRTEDEKKYSLKNDGEKHQRGMYRWVDRVDRYQVTLYPERLQLEFEIPEPATYFRARTAARQNQANAGAPPKFEVTLAEITPSNLLALAQKYRASNFPSLPDEKVSLSVSKTFLQQGGGAAGGGPSPNPALGGEVEVIIPEGYAATRVGITGRAFSAFGPWDDGTGANSHFSLYLVTTVGMAQRENSQGGAVNNVQINSRSLALLNQPVQINLNPRVLGTAKFGVLAFGASHAIVSFEVECIRTAEAYAAWQYAAYDALFASWKQWQEEWEAAQLSDAMLAAQPVNEGSSQRNALTIRDELKRQVITWLLQESPFEGRPALMGAYPGIPGRIAWQTIDLQTALKDAPLIQFLEQAFDWGLMSYIFYPYYWADNDRWDELSNLRANDPDFERFLKAGSARVVVPARKTMEPAVLHYLIYGEPFLNQPMPIPGDPNYLSVAREIQDLTQPPEDGIPGASWEVVSTTTLILLDDKEELPRNTNTKLTTPKVQFCEDNGD